MKKNIFSMTMLISLLLSFHSMNTLAQKPDYEKYGRIAISVVKEDYPGQDIVEYQYMGRQKVSNSEVMDNFRFEVLENKKPKFVLVKIIHNLNNEKLLNLSVEETDK
ncbi:DUF3889 domain-containing protein [Bacillus massilinigeriensis]|uniref:DUF3889 domain-containing protein n=1 Tax=Bacillus massilionigeriensis TaxID=1805475 RepID=UPI00096B47B1|nr:DUF3889 domain-containing protein [Bacillus massilionigeriensis]